MRSNTLHLASYPFLDTLFGFLPPCRGASVPTHFHCRIPLHFWSLEIFVLALWLAVHSKHLLAFKCPYCDDKTYHLSGLKICSQDCNALTSLGNGGDSCTLQVVNNHMCSLWWQCTLGTLVRDKTLVHSQLIFHLIVLMNILLMPHFWILQYYFMTVLWIIGISSHCDCQLLFQRFQRWHIQAGEVGVGYATASQGANKIMLKKALTKSSLLEPLNGCQDKNTQRRKRCKGEPQLRDRVCLKSGGSYKLNRNWQKVCFCRLPCRSYRAVLSRFSGT